MSKKGILFVVGAFVLLSLYLSWSKHVRREAETAGFSVSPTGEKATFVTSAMLKAEPEVTVDDKSKLTVLNSILSAHNDNDLRMDAELKQLSDGAKALFRQRYEEIAPEKRNERGTIVFLLGRNITNEADLSFMEKVLNEEPCRSMQNCGEDGPRTDRSTMHSESGMEISLAYPQIVALKSLERVLQRGENDPLFQKSLADVRAATRSPVSKVAEDAKALERRFSK